MEWLLALVLTPAATITSIQSGPWSDPATWDSGTVPGEHATVAIAEDHTVTYDVASDEVIDLLTVNGTLDFSRTNDTRLTVDQVEVYGTWQMGSADEPLPTAVTATVAITGQTEEIAVYNGTFSVHGAPTDTTWTRLARTAPKDTKTLRLKQAVDWQVGDQIAIASTSYDGSEAEMATIQEVSTNGKVLTLAGGLTNKHYGKNHEFAEVGLLSHNITFGGDEEYDAGHIIFNGSSTVQASNTQFDTLGTYATMAQYPLHFHMMGDAGEGSYIKKVSITNSSNRCITVHATDGVLIQDNVAYHTKGHCYFLEDGVEQDNRFIHNLGMDTSAGATIESDTEPATFWITNPQNTYRRNSAAGSEAFGYWFFLLDGPTGLSEAEEVIPRTLRLQTFNNNTTHSNGDNGLTIDGHGFDSVYYMPTKTAVFRNVTSYKNMSTGIWARGRDLTFTGATVLDNRIGVSFAANNATLTKSVVYGNSGNASPISWRPYVFGFAYYDGPVRVRQTTFRNFRTTTDQPKAGVSIQPNNPYAMSPQSSFERLTFRNARAFFIDDVERAGDMFAVLNNTATNELLLPVLDFHKSSGCQEETAWNVYRCPFIDYGQFVFTDSREKNYTDELTVTRLDTDAAITLVEEGSSSGGRFVMNLPTQRNYRVSAGNIDELKLKYTKSDKSITIRVPYANRPSQITELGLEHDYWNYDTATHEVVLEVRPDREYVIYQ